MKEFVLQPDMLTTLGGVFYPTGYAVVMFPDLEQARSMGQALVNDHGFAADEVELLSPTTVLSQISQTERGNDEPLPSVGTEGQTVRMFDELARKGGYGLVVKTEEDEVSNRLKAVLQGSSYTFGQRYRSLVIEDL